MVMASSMNHEKSRVTEMKIILAREKNEPFFIRVEKSYPMALISTHNLISNDPQLEPRYIATQEREN